jgi:hypothetical protein
MKHVPVGTKRVRVGMRLVPAGAASPLVGATDQGNGTPMFVVGSHAGCRWLFAGQPVET